MADLRAPGITPRQFSRLRRRDLPGNGRLPEVAAVVPSIAIGAANAAVTSGFSNRQPHRTDCFRYYGCIPADAGDGSYQANYGGISLTGSGAAAPWAVEFVSDSPKFHIGTVGKGRHFRVLADGQYLSTYVTTGPPADNQGYWITVDWTAATPQPRKMRHYRIEMAGTFIFSGIAAHPSDTVTAAPYRGKRVAVLGDSFSEPTTVDSAPYAVAGATGQASGDTVTKNGHGINAGTQIQFTVLTSGSGLATATNYWVINPTANTFQVSATQAGSTPVDITVDYSTITYCLPSLTGHEGWPGIIAKLMGCPDVWFQASGGTGYVNPGATGRVKFRDRFAADIINKGIEVLFLAGGVNDSSRSPTITAAMVGTEAAAILTDLKAGLPNCQAFMLSPFLGHMGANLQPGGGADNFLTIRDALKAAADAAGVPFLDVIEPGTTGQATTITTASIGSAITAAASIPKGTTIRVGPVGGGYTWTTRVSGNPTGSGPYSIPVSPNLQSTAPVGAPVTVVGSPYLDGTGYDGNLAGDGNSDYFVGSDGTHPTAAGAEHTGRFVFRRLTTTLAP